MASHKRSQFLQSYNWGEFKKGVGLKIFRLAVFEERKIIFAGQIIKRELPLGNSYLYLPRGPIFSNKLSEEKKQKTLDLFLKEVEKIAKKEDSVFLKIEPSFTDNKIIDYEKKGFRKSACVQPPDTVMVELEKSEEEILKEMHHKTRYNIRLAERKGVKVEFSENPEEVDKFFELTKFVNEREGICCFSKNYYQKMVEEFKKDGNIFFAKGIYQGKTIVINLLISYGDTVVYNHGASANEYRNVMAPHLVQWETIKKAKKESYKYYDFRGIAPTDNPKHKWAGITRFKKGYSNKVVSCEGAYDLVFKSFIYQIYLLGKKIK